MNRTIFKVDKKYFKKIELIFLWKYVTFRSIKFLMCIAKLSVNKCQGNGKFCKIITLIIKMWAPIVKAFERNIPNFSTASRFFF